MQTLLASVSGSFGLACDSETGAHTGVYVHTDMDAYLDVAEAALNLDLMKEPRGSDGND